MRRLFSYFEFMRDTRLVLTSRFTHCSKAVLLRKNGTTDEDHLARFQKKERHLLEFVSEHEQHLAALYRLLYNTAVRYQCNDQI